MSRTTLFLRKLDLQVGVKNIGTLIVALLFVLASVASFAGTPTVAILPGEGERAPLGLGFAQVEAAVSTNGLFALVEREQVRRVLAEHKLTAASLVRGEQAVKLGQLLATDLFVFLERLPRDTNQTWRVEIIESRSGIAIGHLVATGESLARDPAPLVSAIVAALAKCRVPLGQRHYIGVLGFRSEEIGRSLDPLASLLEAWLPFDLATASNVVLLDRKHLDRLTTEEQLSGLELQLKGSALLVRGTLKRVPGTQQLSLRLGLQSPDALTLKPLTLTLATNDLPALRRALATAVFDHLHIAKPTATALDPAREAALFSERARLLHLDGEYEAAAQAAEAAWALDPTFENQMKAAELQNEAGSRAKRRADVLGIRRDQRGQPRLAPEVNRQILRHAVRAAELYRGAVEVFLAQARRQPSPPNSFPHTTGSTFLLYGLQLPVESGDSEVMELRHELQQQSLALFRLERDYYAALWNAPTNGMKPSEHPQWHWSYLLSTSPLMLKERTDDVKVWTGLLRELVANYQNPPGPFTIQDAWGSPPHRFAFWSQMSSCAPVSKFASTEERAVIGQVLDSFARQPGSALGLAALIATLNAQDRLDRTSNLVRKKEFLDLFLREYPYDHPVRRQDDDYWFPANFVFLAVKEVERSTRTDSYSRAILEPILRARDGVRLVTWENLLLDWLNGLDRNGQSRQACELAQQSLDLVPADMQARGSGAVPRLRAALTEIHDRLAPVQPRLTGAWADWELACLTTNAPPTGEIWAAQFQQNQLFTVWVRELDRGHTSLHLMAQNLTGEAATSLGQTEMNGTVRARYGERALVFAADANLACVGASSNGLVIFRNGQIKIFTEENGLPVNDVKAVACLDGEIYLGFSGGIVVLNPGTGRVTELASSRSTKQRSPLDGKSFGPRAFLGDPKCHCVWMSIWGRDALGGLWRYEANPNPRSDPPKAALSAEPAIRPLQLALPASAGGFRKIFTPPSDTFAGLSLQRGQLVANLDWPAHPPVAAIHPETGVPVWLLYNEGGPSSKAPLFGPSGDGDVCWLWRGEELITGGAMLGFRTRTNNVPAMLSRSLDGKSLSGIVSLYEPEPGRILFVTTRGELWRLRQTSARKAPRTGTISELDAAP